MGNSEVGHLNLGAGRPVLPELPRIDAAIADGTFGSQPALVTLLERARTPSSALHLVSLVGPGGVHAHDRHLVEVARLARGAGVERVLVHALLDGRDTPPRSGAGFLEDLEGRLALAHPGARIASVGGRYYAMDRDGRWERVAAGYAAMVAGVGERASSAVGAVEASYRRGVSDEFVVPVVIDAVDGRIRDGHAVLHCNFRADRARELTHALVDEPFGGFDRGAWGPVPRDLVVGTMTDYAADLAVLVVFPPEIVRSLSEAIAAAGFRQFHVAETEKYAHVTYFFNGGVEAPWPGEDRVLIPSSKVATYDLEPAMRADSITEALVAALESDRYDFLIANYANADMVGHTGDWEATLTACEILDRCIGRIVVAVEARESRDPTGPGALLLVTADHGNADEMIDRSGRPVTAHSLNPVPIVAIGRSVVGRRLADGVLADVAPTIVAAAGLAPWPGITGHSLLEPGFADPEA